MAKAQRADATPADDAEGVAQEEFADVADLSYEQARDELIAIVTQLEGGQAGLEESMRLWRRGEALAAHCSTWLDGAEAALSGDDTD
jgi:exodeoxyribonuclease VII small subunit